MTRDRDRDRFEFRLGVTDRDRELSRQLRRYSQKKGSASDLIKELLRAYFSGELDRFNQPGEQTATEAIDERTAAVLAKIKRIDFQDLE